jgi:hypothetical protein
MELLYYYALAHQSSFDVRWLKTGSISNKIFLPLCKKLSNDYNFTLLSSARVDSIALKNTNITIDGNICHQANKISYSQFSRSTGVTTKYDLANIDGVILAVGSKGLSNILNGSPELSRLSPRLTKAATLGSIDCISCRIWLNEGLF